MVPTIEVEPEQLYNQWSLLYERLRFSNLAVVPPAFTREQVIEMQEREVPRMPIFVHPGIGRTYILDMGVRGLKMSFGTYSTLQRLSRVHAAGSGWVFVEASEQAPFKRELKSGIQPQEVLVREGALGMSIEEYAIFAMYCREFLHCSPDTHGSSLLRGSQSTTGNGVWAFTHDADGLCVADSASPKFWAHGLGMRSVIQVG